MNASMPRPLTFSPSGESEQRDKVAVQCPNCGRALGTIHYGAAILPNANLRCENCSFVLASDRGIWRTLTPERQRYYERFLMEYQIVRAAEGRGAEDASFYLALPYKDLTGRNEWQWAIRSRTFRSIEQEILPKLEQETAAPLRILDLGAGNGWLSYRLVIRGDRPVAVDLLTNKMDGLGAACHYLQQLPILFPRFHAELDRLPFSDSQFDCAIFNASFHYSEDYARTLGEAIRCLRPGGMAVIADSPFYETEESGRRMVQEKHTAFAQHFGFASDSLASLEYLTTERLIALESRFGISWQTIEPNYGLRWAIRPVIAKWRGQREPSKFRIYTAVVKTQ